MINTKDENVVPPSYTSSEAIALFEAHGLSESTFFRWVKQNKIKKYPPPVGRVKGARYDKAQIDSLIRLSTEDNETRNARESTDEKPEALSVLVSPVEQIIEELNQTLLPYAFVLNYEQRSFKEFIPSETMWAWQEITPVFWCLYELNNPKDIIALLGMLPLSEDQILHILRKELSLRDIKPSDILPSSTNYYMIVDADVELERAGSLTQLAQHVFSYWCEEGIQITSIYTETKKDSKQIPFLNLIRDFDFALRPDIGSGVRQLNTTDYTVSPFVQKYKDCIEEKKKKENNTMIEMPVKESLVEQSPHHVKDRVRNFSRFRPLDPSGFIRKGAQFRRAISDDDIRSILRINALLFGKSKRSEEELLQSRRSWLTKNPEIYHVLEVDGNIVGFLSMFPLKMEMIDKLISEEIVVSQIRVEDILPYEPGRPVDIFVQTLGVDPTIEELSEGLFRRYGSFLIKGLMDLFFRWGQQGVEISSVYARSDTEYGIYTSLGLGFKEIPAPPGVHKKIFLLDVAHSGQVFLMEYMNALKNYWKNLFLQKQV